MTDKQKYQHALEVYADLTSAEILAREPIADDLHERLCRIGPSGDEALTDGDGIGPFVALYEGRVFVVGIDPCEHMDGDDDGDDLSLFGIEI